MQRLRIFYSFLYKIGLNLKFYLSGKFTFNRCERELKSTNLKAFVFKNIELSC